MKLNLKSCLIATSLVTALSSNFAFAELDDISFASVVKTFKINGNTAKLYSGSMGTSCPQQFVVVMNGKESVAFGSCSEYVKSIKQSGDKIIITAPGFRGPFSSPKEQAAASKEIWQYTYRNGKVTEKRIK
ncbi:hypothetical protein A4G19_02955 [Pasteurellaceae bacterium Macca]|nr:hypothetical protein [Pasteurellaceae bacterium Macca]